jgi:ribosomal protein S18 acetylase RimI-like enzyme
MRKRAMRIRRARPGDGKTILALVGDHEPEDTPFAARYLRRYFARDPLLARDRLFVTEIEGKVVGVSGYHVDHFVSDDAHWLSWFIVAPECRGEENGSPAARMLAAVVGKLFVATASSNGRAVRFYLKHNFEMEGRLADYYSCGEDQLILGRYL